MFHRLMCIALATFGSVAIAQTVPPGYPADYAQTIAAAKKEGKVVLYTSVETEFARALTSAFEAKYPTIRTDIFRPTRKFLAG